MDDEYDEEECCTHPSYPWSWKSAGVYVGDFLTNILRDAATLIEGLSVQVAASCNHDIDQREFRDAVVRDIETIVDES